MGKSGSKFNSDGTPRKRVRVRSVAYGDHDRAARGTYKKAVLNDAMKQSGALLPTANRFAKAVKDVFDPFRTTLWDGSLWSRLVKIFKLQLHRNSAVDFHRLEGLQFSRKRPLNRLFSSEVQATAHERILALTSKTFFTAMTQRDRAERFQQTMVAVFYSRELEAKAYTESAIFPLKRSESHEQVARFAIPDFAAMVIVALKCEFVGVGVCEGLLSGKGMTVVKVLDLANV